ncbi:MAG: hypothetical protein QOD77_2152 [Thermoplasmata archaeon]|nr:hypothetical protein [Thermoplasmata archaeon]
MDDVAWAFVAGLAAVASILAAAVLPLGRLDLGRVRLFGAASIALTGAQALGAGLPGWLPLAVLAAGVGVAACGTRPKASRSPRT